MKPGLYMETSVVSYLAARPSRDSILAGQQASTHRWWKEKRRNYEIFLSKLVWQEAAKGDKTAAERRLKLIRPFRWLQATAQVMKLARAMVVRKAVPPNAVDDAMHIALGAVYRMEFLLTWNFTHINNPATEELVREVCRQHGFHCPVICTPDQLLSV
ncbi:MAG: type II toxin-antitoxin system VapC family toxin [Verrucomicrobia bacterium]|nr:type II toxin-antitoxin system VapC family toxin [Verrucomicrobiota bacterium]